MFKHITKKLVLSIFMGIFIGLGIFVTYATSLTSVSDTINTGDTLSTDWYNDIKTRLTNIYGSGSNVGIGTANPTEKLEIAGNVKATSFVGNTTSATKLATARTIAGVFFDGTANIAIPFANITSQPAFSANANAGRVRMYEVGCESSWGSSCDSNTNGRVDNADSAGNSNTLGGLGSASFRQWNAWQYNHYSGSDGAEYATILRDTDNSGYYVDPSYNSNFAGTLTLGGNMTINTGKMIGPNGYFLLFQGDGNMVRYNPSGVRRWQSNNPTLVNSDRRLKSNIKILDQKETLEKIKKLEGVSYNLKSDGRKDLGLIAQDVEKIFPELVFTDNSKDKMKQLEYAGLISPMIQAIKEQQNQIDSLKSIVCLDHPTAEICK